MKKEKGEFRDKEELKKITEKYYKKKKLEGEWSSRPKKGICDGEKDKKKWNKEKVKKKEGKRKRKRRRRKKNEKKANGIEEEGKLRRKSRRKKKKEKIEWNKKVVMLEVKEEG